METFLAGTNAAGIGIVVGDSMLPPGLALRHQRRLSGLRQAVVAASNYMG
jgi:hypothetical protein